MKKNKRTLTPKLRFPEFLDKSGWEAESLGRMFVNRQEKGFSDLPLLSVTDERGVILQEETNRRDNSSNDKSKYLRVLPGDIAYNTMRMWEGRSGYVDREGLVSPAYTVCQPQKGKHGKFFSYYFKTASLIEQFRKYSQGLVKDTLNLKYNGFACISIPSPLFAEQQKIADCLSSLDGLIAAEGRALEALKAYKKGLMQQLFPQPGQTQPRLRFPEFRDKGEWESKPFGKVVVRSFYGTSNSTSENGQYPVLRMGNMVNGKLDFSNLVYIDLDPASFAKIRLIRGDILLNRTNSLDLVGKISMFDRDIECITASYIVTYRLDKKQIVPSFCNLMLNTQQYQSKIKALARPSVSQANINPTTFRNELVVFVPKIAEQQKIADCLTALDTRIAAQAAKIDALKIHKRGLMQQLFPTPEE